MVQVFGNRILGGVGAPGGGMSESFGAGVNTALNQRASRQAMVGEGQRQNILAQEQAFRIEDRADAKKRQAAAAAAAASSRARAAGLVAAQQRIFGAAPGGSGVAGLNLGAPAGTGRDRQGPAAPPSRATVPTAPVAPRNAPARSMGVEAPISGGAGRGVTGGAGDDQLAGVRAPTTMLGARGFEQRTGLPADLDAYLSRTEAQRDPTALATYGVSAGIAPPPPAVAPFATQAGAALPYTEGPLPAYVGAPGLFSAAVGGLPGAANAEVLFREGWVDETEYQQLVRGSRAQQGEVLTKVARRQMGVADEQTQAAQTSALTAAPTVTIQGPNGPVTVPTEEPAPAAPAPATAVPADFTSPAQLRFGPDLGAPTRTSEEVMVDEFVSSIGVDPYAPAPPTMGEPGQPGRAITDLLTRRDQEVQWAQALLDAEQYGDARAVQDGIALIDAKLEAAVARQAIEEARVFNAPQRLNAIWSGNTARNYEFVPTAEGIYDVYIDGQLQFPGMSMDQITQDTLTMTDQVYAQQQAELAAKFAEAQAQAGGTAAGEAPFEANAALLAADIAVTQAGLMTEIEVDRDMRIRLNDITKQRIEASLSTQGILPKQAREFKYVETDMGGVQIFDGDRLVVEYVPQESQRQDGSTFVTLAPVNQ